VPPRDGVAHQRARTARDAQAALRKLGWDGITVQPGPRGKPGAYALVVEEEVLLRMARLG